MKNDTLSGSIKTIAKGSGIGLIGAMFGTGIGYLSRIVIARYLGPEDYGLISLGFAVMMIGATFSLLGLNAGVKRYVPYYIGKNDASRIKGTIISAFKLAIPFSIITLLFVVLGSNWISNSLFNEPNLKNVLIIFAFAIPFWVLATIFSSASIGFQKIEYHIYSMYLFKDSSKLIFILFFLLLGYGVIGAALGWVLAIVGMALVSFYFLERKVYPVFTSSIQSIEIHKELFSFSFPLIFVGISTMITGWADTFMIGYFLNASKVGIYNAALPTSQLLGMPIGPISNIFGPVIVVLYAKDRLDDLKAIYSIVTKWIFSLAFPGFLVMALFSKEILNLLFGELYIEGSTAMSILLFCVFITALVGPAVALITAYGKTQIIMYCSLFGAAINLALNYFMIPVYGINGAAMATGFSLALVSFLNFIFVYKIGKIQPFRFTYIKPFFAAIVAIVAIYLTKNYLLKDLLDNAILIIFVFGLLYMFILILMKPFEHEDFVVIDAIDQKLGTHSIKVKNYLRRRV